MATRGLRDWPYLGSSPDDLPPAELTLLDSIRAWEHARGKGQAPACLARLVLAAEGAGAAAPALDGMLRAFTARGDARLGCTLSPRIVRDEPLIILTAALAQRQARREALALLLTRLPAALAYPAMASAIPLGCHFRLAGLRFRDPWTMGVRPDSRPTSDAPARNRDA